MRIYTILATKGTKFLARKLFKDYASASEYVEELASKFNKQYDILDDCEDDCEMS